MKMNDKEFFNVAFRVLTGHEEAFPWQKRLYFDNFRKGVIPSFGDLPTSFGKTSIIPIWLISFARIKAENLNVYLPRRLFYEVNRRTVVDQATKEVEKIRDSLNREDWTGIEKEIIDYIRNALFGCSVINREKQPFGLSTLRGEHADNQEWKFDITRPSITIGTIDKIGSNLLFSGYGDSTRLRPVHAALVGQDSLLVYDEAHLDPAFEKALREIETVQKTDGSPYPMRVMSLSATLRDLNNKDVFQADQDDFSNAILGKRFHAEKWMKISVVKNICKAMAKDALVQKNSVKKVLIYVHPVKSATSIYKSIEKKVGSDRVRLLMGPIRGFERDNLVKNDPVYKQFLCEAKTTETVYLIATAAGEVGLDIDADYMICDLVTLERMMQRFGRTNRFGNTIAYINVYVSDKIKKSPQDKTKDILDGKKLIRVMNLLKTLPTKNGFYDASIRALGTITGNTDAYESLPLMSSLDPLLLDSFTFTSIQEKHFGRGKIANFLHGYEANIPQTNIVWRDSVTALTKIQNPETLSKLFESIPFRTKEQIHDNSKRVRFGFLLPLAKACASDTKVIVMDTDGLTTVCKLWDVFKMPLEEYTVFLPTDAGGLSPLGTLDASNEDTVKDVSVESDGKVFRKTLKFSREVWKSDDLSAPTTGDLTKKIASSTKADEIWRGVLEEKDDTPTKILVYFKERSVGYRPPSKEQTLDEHQAEVRTAVERITQKLRLNGNTQSSLLVAAEHHDDGKGRAVWQKAVGNTNGIPLAKTTHAFDTNALNGYRHEFGSFTDLRNAESVSKHPERDLILHAVCTHHGHARPHFENTDDPNHPEFLQDENSEQLLLETMLRFERLQRRFGRWGLAWLESILRLADWLASAGEIKNVET
jgi:CRISPR-associated endonuclease/helicase Cas3